MFHGGFAEESQSEVKIEGVTEVALDALVRSSDGLDMKLENLPVFQVLEAAGMLQFCSVQKKCCHFLIEMMNRDISMAIKVLQVAEYLVENELYNKALRYILWNFPQVSKSAKFSKIKVQSLQHVLDHEHLNVSSELEVYGAIQKWISIDQKAREGHAQKLFQCLRSMSEKELRLISADDIKFRVDRKDRRLPKFPCCIGRYKKSPYVFLYDTVNMKVEPFLSLTNRATSNGLTACGFQVGSSGTCLYVFGGEFSLGRGNWNTSVSRYVNLNVSIIQC